MSFLRSYQRPAFKRRLMAGIVPNWLRKHKRATYITSAVLSFPFWVDREELKLIQKECDDRTAQTGIPHHVDHKIPIRHPKVCGLTVPWNLQIITQFANLKKSGKFSPQDFHQHELPI
jgi:hypothetical protein